MQHLSNHQQNIKLKGFTILEDIYKSDEIEAILNAINKADQSKPTFRKTNDIFAIRQFLKEVPEVKQLIFNDKLKSLINNLFGYQYFIVKSIYFDKPEKSNWFVGWHQDLTIAVDKKAELHGYGHWTVKFNQFAVQPPIDILRDNFTLRIHLDDTNAGNGALMVKEGSHLNCIVYTENLDFQNKEKIICNVSAGGVMVMHPLLMHASNRTTSNKQRRVIHIEFSKAELPAEINWSEKNLY
jgi:ectoine hydroxylase-related dioxygenase (phytanoyl-CoA dioxygenase family)